jgi:hypothetical protein
VSYRWWLVVAAAGVVAAAALGWLSAAGGVVGDLYDEHVVETGKRPAFFLFVGVVLGFALIRLNTRLRRAGVRWWPGTIEHGDTHVHHAVFGLLGMIAAGILEFALRPASPTVELLALAFGGAIGVTLDEFALVFHLEDVYWEEEGRKSIDVVILFIVVTAMFVVGAVPLGLTESARAAAGPRWVVAFLIVANFALVLVTLLKGRLWLGVIGFLLPPIAWFGALRLARPGSPWARRWYRERPDILEKSRRRDEAFHARWGQLKHRVWDLIGGSPTKRTT